jgi:hypothetical protein
MFMVPASKVSVPLTVVIRIWVSVPPRSTYPPTIPPFVDDCTSIPEELQAVPPKLTIVICPRKVFAELCPLADAKNPVVLVVIDPFVVLAYELYPVDTNPLLVPSLTKNCEFPLPLIVLNINVTLLTQLGIPVKSTLVPVADFAVSLTRVNPESVPSIVTGFPEPESVKVMVI